MISVLNSSINANAPFSSIGGLSRNLDGADFEMREAG
jgi:hypothetical protein